MGAGVEIGAGTGTETGRSSDVFYISDHVSGRKLITVLEYKMSLGVRNLTRQR